MSGEKPTEDPKKARRKKLATISAMAIIITASLIALVWYDAQTAIITNIGVIDDEEQNKTIMEFEKPASLEEALTGKQEGSP